jgi:hypothetical protein
VAGIAVAAAIGSAIIATRSSHVDPTVGRLQELYGTGPSVNLTAMRNEGELAFVSRGDLYLLDGAAGTVHEIPVAAGRTAVGPTFSPDGKWVAYETEEDEVTDGDLELWVVRSNATDRHRVTGAGGYYGWDPAEDLLAISTGTPYAQLLRGSLYHGTADTRLELVSPTGTRRDLVNLPVPTKPVVYPPRGIWDASWSPSGQAIAVAIDSFMSGSTIRSYPLDGGKPTTWFSINASASLPGLCSKCGGGHNTIAQLAGWWAKWGVGFWVFSGGAVHGLDSSPLELVHSPGAAPHLIGHTLSTGTTDAIASGPRGDLALVSSAADVGRSYGIGKEVETCDLSSLDCSPVPAASTWTRPDPVHCSQECSRWPASGKVGSAVSLDPAWSPNGHLLAYVKSPLADTGGQPPLSWFGAHRLYVFNTATHRSTELVGVDGSSVPTWSRNGKDILYVSNDALWLTPATGGRAVEVASPLFPPAEWEDIVSSGLSFYGQVTWASQFTWWSP